VDGVTAGLNVTRNALMLAGLCGGIVGLIKHLEQLDQRRWYVYVLQRFCICFFLPLLTSLASAISGNYSLGTGIVFFTVSCSLVLAIIIILCLYLILIPLG
jgi:hypothetical protein